jgi:hypothetical protein
MPVVATCTLTSHRPTPCLLRSYFHGFSAWHCLTPQGEGQTLGHLYARLQQHPYLGLPGVYEWGIWTPSCAEGRVVGVYVGKAGEWGAAVAREGPQLAAVKR